MTQPEFRSDQVLQAVASFASAGRRSAQEDFALPLKERGILVVADGFGGPGPGAAASRCACEAVQGFLVKEAGDREATMPFELRSYFSLAGNVLFNALIHANRRVRKLNHGKDVNERGGASLIAGYLDGDLLALASIGGCSAWLWREGRARELVTPRTYGRLLDPFAAAAAGSPGFEDVPLAALGMAEDLQPEIVELRVRAGDRVLFHTDGLTGAVRDVVLGARATSAEAAAQDALLALERGEYADNVAAVLAVF